MLVEALASILAAAARLKTSSFEQLVPTSQVDGATGISKAEASQIERAIDGWARRLPGKPACFIQGLAATAMLRRRGYLATLHYGSRRGDAGLEAHVWVSSGGEPVIGHRNADQFAELSLFPSSG
nr:lasso peptide biosynthesis B2 protein [Sphingomicrobium sediminis]